MPDDMIKHLRCGVPGATAKLVSHERWFPVFNGDGDTPKNLIALFRDDNDAWRFMQITELEAKLAESQQALGEIIPRAVMALNMGIKSDPDGVRVNLLSIEKIARTAIRKAKE